MLAKRVFVGLGLVSLAGGCATQGERAYTGECPDGEICSDETPEGLLFEGPGLSDNFLLSPGGIKVTAAGGSQTLRVLRPDDDRGERRPFALAFDATIESPFAVESTSPPEVEVSTESDGTAVLRILERDTGHLYDRVSVAAEPIDSVEVVPFEHADEDEWLLYAPGQPRVVAKLFAGDGEQRLVDEGLALSVADSAAEASPVDWDTAAVSGLAEGVSDVVVTSSSGDEFSAAVEAVSSIDEIAPADPMGAPGDGAEIGTGEVAIYCFAGKLEGVVVAGLDWEFAAEGPIEVEPWDVLPRCAEITAGDEPDAATLAVSAGELEQGYDIDVIEREGQSSLLRRVPVIESEPATPGARAAAAGRANDGVGGGALESVGR